MDLLLIGGVSGSGKSVALAALEDSGYYSVNNLPPSLLAETAEYLARSGQERVAVALDVKTGPGLPLLGESISALRDAGWTVRFLYLDAKTDTLVKRFSETRRRHPFSSNERTLTEECVPIGLQVNPQVACVTSMTSAQTSMGKSSGRPCIGLIPAALRSTSTRPNR